MYLFMIDCKIVHVQKEIEISVHIMQEKRKKEVGNGFFNHMSALDKVL